MASVNDVNEFDWLQDTEDPAPPPVDEWWNTSSSDEDTGGNWMPDMSMTATDNPGDSAPAYDPNATTVDWMGAANYTPPDTAWNDFGTQQFFPDWGAIVGAAANYLFNAPNRVANSDPNAGDIWGVGNAPNGMGGLQKINSMGNDLPWVRNGWNEQTNYQPPAGQYQPDEFYHVNAPGYKPPLDYWTAAANAQRGGIVGRGYDPELFNPQTGYTQRNDMTNALNMRELQVKGKGYSPGVGANMNNPADFNTEVLPRFTAENWNLRPKTTPPPTTKPAGNGAPSTWRSGGGGGGGGTGTGYPKAYSNTPDWFEKLVSWRI